VPVLFGVMTVKYKNVRTVSYYVNRLLYHMHLW